MNRYTFDPAQFGFRKMPAAYAAYWGQGEQWYKVTSKNNASIWFKVCKRVEWSGRDDRWRIYSAACGIGHVEDTTSHIVFMGCITTHQFAESLLIHVLGSHENSTTIEHGRQRLEAPFLEYEQPHQQAPND